MLWRIQLYSFGGYMTSCAIWVSLWLLMFLCIVTTRVSIFFKHVFYDRTKHIEIDRHITYQEYEKGRIILFYVPSEAQLTNLFTKAQTLTVSRDFVQILDV